MVAWPRNQASGYRIQSTSLRQLPKYPSINNARPHAILRTTTSDDRLGLCHGVSWRMPDSFNARNLARHGSHSLTIYFLRTLLTNRTSLDVFRPGDLDPGSEMVAKKNTTQLASPVLMVISGQSRPQLPSHNLPVRRCRLLQGTTLTFAQHSKRDSSTGTALQRHTFLMNLKMNCYH